MLNQTKLKKLLSKEITKSLPQTDASGVICQLFLCSAEITNWEHIADVLVMYMPELKQRVKAIKKSCTVKLRHTAKQ